MHIKFMIYRTSKYTYNSFIASNSKFVRTNIVYYYYLLYSLIKALHISLSHLFWAVGQD
jgi:hypothetical protein